MFAIGVECRAMTGVEMGAVFHDHDRRLNRFERRAAGFQDGPTGLQRPMNIDTRRCPFRLAEVIFRHHAAATVYRKCNFCHGSVLHICAGVSGPH